MADKQIIFRKGFKRLSISGDIESCKKIQRYLLQEYFVLNQYERGALVIDFDNCKSVKYGMDLDQYLKSIDTHEYTGFNIVDRIVQPRPIKESINLIYLVLGLLYVVNEDCLDSKKMNEELLSLIYDDYSTMKNKISKIIFNECHGLKIDYRYLQIT